MIKNIIFDLCGPIITIDINLINNKLQQYGVNGDNSYKTLHSADLTRQFEAGQLTPEAFCDAVRQVLTCNLSNEQIFDAWNTLITDFPQKHIDTMKTLSRRYRLFLLSNSDVINARFFHDELNRLAGFDFIEEIFERAYFSYETSMRKPNPKIFQYILDNHHLKKEETLFIDDCLNHITGAQEIGLQTHFLEPGTDICDLRLI